MYRNLLQIIVPYLTIDLDVSKICLKKQEGVLHTFNIQYVRTLEAAFDASVNLNSWEEAEHYGKRLIPGYLSVSYL